LNENVDLPDNDVEARARRAAMEPASNASRRLASKFLLTVIPGLVASGVAASVLYAIHASRAPAVSEYLSAPTANSDGLSAEERRDLTRQMLRARRDNAEQPGAATLPLPPAGAGDAMDGDATAVGDSTPADAGDVKAADTKPVDIRPADTRPVDPRSVDPRPVDQRSVDTRPVDQRPADGRPADARPPQGGVAVRIAPAAPDNRTLATAPLPAPRPAVRPRPDAGASVALTPAPPPPPAVAAAPAGPGAPVQLSPGSAANGAVPTGAPPAGNLPTGAQAAVPPPPQPEPQHGFGANVLSGISSVAGSAANATGNTVNWVIDLPGKAINAGGKLIGINRNADDQAPAAQQPPAGTAQPPGTAPAKHL